MDENSPEQLAESERANEEFISAPEDTVENPLVPAPEEEVDVSKIEGVIGSGNLEENNVEEVAMPTETETPVAPAAEAPVTAAPAAEPAVVAAAPKKKKTGLIVTLIILILLLLGGGAFFLFFFVLRNTTPNLVNDAVGNFMTSENLTASSLMEMEDSNGTTIDMKISRAGSNFGVNSVLKSKAEGQDINITADGSMIDGGNLYFKLGGLKTDIDVSFFYGLMAGISGQDLSQMSDEEISAMVSFMKPMYTKMSGNWYKAGESDLKNFSGDTASCLFEFQKLLSSDNIKALADIYKANAFIVPKEGAEIKEDGGIKKIAVIFNKEKYDAFRAEMKKSGKFEVSEKCKESEQKDGQKSEDIFSKMVERFKSDGADFYINGDHKLVGAKIGKVEFKIGYDKTDIAAPSDAKPFSELTTLMFSGLGNLGNLGNLGGGTGNSGLGNLGGGSGSSSTDDLGGLLELLQLLGGSGSDSGDTGDDSGLGGLEDLLKLFGSDED